MKKLGRTILVLKLLVLLTAFFSGLVRAETVQISFEIPDVDTSQYRRPFVAIWIEDKKNWKDNQTFALWFDDDQWLKDIRRWWRKVGRYNKDIDGFSGATKAAGRYSVAKDIVLEKGKSYTLYVEAVREHGNRTLLKTSLSLGDAGKTITLNAGKEIGPVTIKLLGP